MYLYPFRYVLSNADNAPEDSLARGGGSRCLVEFPQVIRILIFFFVGSFALDFVLSTDGKYSGSML